MLYFIITILFGLLAAYFSKEFFKPGPEFAVFISLVGFLFVIIGLFQCSEAWHLNHKYEPTVCTVAGHFENPRTMNCPELFMKYTVDNQPYEGMVSLPCQMGHPERDKLLAQFGIGEQHPCWYDAQDHSKISLRHYQNPMTSYFLIGVGFYLIFWMVYQTELRRRSTVNSTSTTPLGMIFEAWMTKWLLLCLLAVFIGLYMIDSDWYAARAYNPTQCRVLDKKLESEPDKAVTWYHSTLYVSYQAGTHPYQQWIRLSQLSTGDRESEQAALDKYTLNQDYTCWYNPEDPAAVVLVQGVSTFSVGWTIISAILLIVSILLWKLGKMI